MYGPDLNGRFQHVTDLINEANVQDIVFLNHEVSGKQKEDILLDADIFIQTSRFEGMPMGILEAMSYGLPCLVTEGTTLSGIIAENECGWSAKTNIEDIAMKIKKAVTESEIFVDKGRNSQKIITKFFTWEKISDLAIDRYKKIAFKEN